MPSFPLLSKARGQQSRSAASDYDKEQTKVSNTQAYVPVRLNSRSHSSTFPLCLFAALDDAMCRATYAGLFVYVPSMCIERGRRGHNSAPLGGADYAF
jgi:hypothetical protein